MNSLWLDLGARANVILSTAQADALSRYLDLLLAMNQKINLTRITDRAAAELHHVADSLTLLPYLPRGPITIADIGSGGGAPGIPLAIVRPDAQITLIESTKKKAAFLRSAVDELGLANVTVRDQRAEEAARTNLRETFDVTTARAVGTLNWLAEWCLPLTKRGGKMLAMKGAKTQEELPGALHPIKLVGGGEPIIHPVDLSGTEHHVIVEIPKIIKTERFYPRDPTATRGKPLE